MKTLRIVFAIMLISIFVININPSVFAGTIKYIVDENIQLGYTTNVVVKGKKPKISGMKSARLEKEINDSIKKSIDDEIKLLSDIAESIEYSYDVKISDDIVSILLYSTINGGGASENRVKSFNFDMIKEKIINLSYSKILGPNSIKISNKIISDEIKDKNRQAVKFSGITEEQSFYVYEDIVYILFNSYEIAPGYEGIQEIKVPIKSILTRTIDKDKTYSKEDNYNIKMIQLKAVMDAYNDLNYRTDWNPKTGDINIYKDVQYITRVKVGVNQYYKGRSSNRQLEAAPEINPKDQRTYVPISFFEDIMDIYFSIDNAGRVTFSIYTGE